MDEKILEFIAEHHVLTLATAVNNQPYCANCFYVYLPHENCFVFSSDTDTKHGSDALANSYVAASIVLETETIGKIRGLQINGTLQPVSDELKGKAKLAYLKRFPYAILKQTTLWTLQVEFFKMTDNRLGFGKKLIWGSLRQ